MRVTAPDVVLDRLPVPRQDVIDHAGRLGGRQARRARHPVDEVEVMHRLILRLRSLNAKFLPVSGQKLGIRANKAEPIRSRWG